MHVGIHQTQRGNWPWGLDEMTTAAQPRVQSTLYPRVWSSLNALLMWLGWRSRPLHHSKIQGTLSVQIAAALEATWQRDFPGRCGPPHQCPSCGRGSPAPVSCVWSRWGWQSPGLWAEKWTLCLPNQLPSPTLDVAHSFPSSAQFKGL